MIDFDFNNNCYCCSLCHYICPVEAITYDDSLKPIVNKNKCIDCHLCESACLHLNFQKNESAFFAKSAFLALNCDRSTRMNSSSGGVFFQLAKHVVDTNGLVCGCVYDDNMLPYHVLTNDINVVRKMMGSKYVISDLKECISEINIALENGSQVLFSGVPCQVEAVNRSVKNTENLILVGVVCHGPMPRNFWKRYLEEETEGKKITSVTMRDKSKGWLNYGLKFVFSDGSHRASYRHEDGYLLKCYTDGFFQMNRCLNCNYKGTSIRADILLGDAWGMDKLYPEMDDGMGLSAVLCLTKKGEDLYWHIESHLKDLYVHQEEIVSRNQRIVTPAHVNPLRKKFLHEYNYSNLTFHELCKKYANPTLIMKAISKIAR